MVACRLGSTISNISVWFVTRVALQHPISISKPYIIFSLTVSSSLDLRNTPSLPTYSVNCLRGLHIIWNVTNLVSSIISQKSQIVIICVIWSQCTVIDLIIFGEAIQNLKFKIWIAISPKIFPEWESCVLLTCLSSQDSESTSNLLTARYAICSWHTMIQWQ